MTYDLYKDCIDLISPGSSFHSLIADGIKELANNSVQYMFNLYYVQI